MGYPNCMDYLAGRGRLSFDIAPFCEGDSLVFALLAYGAFSGIVPEGEGTISLSQGAELLSALPGKRAAGPVGSRLTPELIAAAGASRRFRDLALRHWVSVLDKESQFAALTIHLPDGSLFVAFRGSDNSLTAWKECFLMSAREVVPAQDKAAKYLSAVAARYPACPLRLGGHSKGGSLAIWAALHAEDEVRERILSIHSFDGPGFFSDLTGLPAYRELADRLSIFVPQGSIVGTLLCQDPQVETIRSHHHRTIGQHDPFTWEIRDGCFRRLPRRSLMGRRSARVMEHWIASMDLEERERFTQALFGLLASGGVRSLSHLTDSLGRNSLKLGRAFTAMPPADRRLILRALRSLIWSMGTGGFQLPAFRK